MHEPKHQRRTITNYIVIHYAETDPNWHGDIDIEDVRDWHTTPKEEGGRGWIDVGYHFFINRSGIVQVGRPIWAVGAHVRGYNQQSIGICLEGGAKMPPGGDSVDDLVPTTEWFTKIQMTSLRALVASMKMKYPEAKVQGHRDFPGVTKDCPGFNAIFWWRFNNPLPDNMSNGG